MEKVKGKKQLIRDHIAKKIRGREGGLAPAADLQSASLLSHSFDTHFNPFFNLSSREIGFIHQAKLR